MMWSGGRSFEGLLTEHIPTQHSTTGAQEAGGKPNRPRGKIQAQANRRGSTARGGAKEMEGCRYELNRDDETLIG